ncbi:MAG: TRAP transporter large permease [Anaerovorax sp.]|nr:TRAP transporter large permease [Anaerovorax sp.]
MSSGMIILIAALFIMLAVGVPIGFAIGGATMLAMITASSLNMVTSAQYCYSGISSFTVMAIPFFMLAGTIMSTGGIAKRIVDFCSALIGFVDGALGCVTTLACMFFGALSGSGMATTSAIGGMMIPEMKKKGYDPSYAATLVCFGGIVGPIIPPSLSFVLYGACTGVSVPSLFLAGILPGIILGFLYLGTNVVMCRKLGQDLKQGKPQDVISNIVATHEANKNAEVELLPAGVVMEKRSKRIARTFKDGFWALLSPVIILGGIYSGIFTPTEAACVSVIYSVIISLFVYHDMNYKSLYGAFLSAAILNGVTSFLLGTSTVFSTFITFEKVPQAITAFLTSVSDNRYIVLLLINIMLLLIGCLLDTVPAIIIMAPILLPAIKAFDISPIQFGVIMAVNLAIGLCTPPYGCNLFVGAAVAKIKMQDMFKYIVPFMFVSIIGLLLITYIPAISIGLL